jgi:hypothetical protein
VRVGDSAGMHRHPVMQSDAAQGRCTFARGTAVGLTSMMPMFAAEPASGYSSSPPSVTVSLCSRQQRPVHPEHMPQGRHLRIGAESPALTSPVS